MIQTKFVLPCGATVTVDRHPWGLTCFTINTPVHTDGTARNGIHINDRAVSSVKLRVRDESIPQIIDILKGVKRLETKEES